MFKSSGIGKLVQRFCGKIVRAIPDHIEVPRQEIDESSRQGDCLMNFIRDAFNTNSAILVNPAMALDSKQRINGRGFRKEATEGRRFQFGFQRATFNSLMIILMIFSKPDLEVGFELGKSFAGVFGQKTLTNRAKESFNFASPFWYVRR